MSIAETTAVRQNLYEGMFLIESGRFASDPEGATAAIMAVLERAGAEIVAHRPWQDGKLAYPIEDHRKGTHYLICFKMPGEAMSVLNRQAQLSDAILRHMVIRHTPELFDAVVGAITGTTTPEEEEATAAAGSETEAAAAPEGEAAKTEEAVVAEGEAAQTEDAAVAEGEAAKTEDDAEKATE